MIVSSNAQAGVVQIARAANIPVLVVDKGRFNETGYVRELKEANVDFIVLAGFLWKVPTPLIEAYPRRIINLHPALLPKFGGKGMYGERVHKAVLASKEPESGMTIHYVDEVYDHGDIIFQASCKIEPGETPESLASKIHRLEHLHYSRVIEQILADEKKNHPAKGG